jgi:hypothetical protein
LGSRNAGREKKTKVRPGRKNNENEKKERKKA